MPPAAVPAGINGEPRCSRRGPQRRGSISHRFPRPPLRPSQDTEIRCCPPRQPRTPRRVASDFHHAAGRSPLTPERKSKPRCATKVPFTAPAVPYMFGCSSPNRNLSVPQVFVATSGSLLRVNIKSKVCLGMVGNEAENATPGPATGDSPPEHCANPRRKCGGSEGDPEFSTGREFLPCPRRERTSRELPATPVEHLRG
jgi:hypothetical protein